MAEGNLVLNFGSVPRIPETAVPRVPEITVPLISKVDSAQIADLIPLENDVVPPQPNSILATKPGIAKLTTKGSTLSFVAPMLKDGYYPTIAAVHKYIAENWSVIAKPDVFCHDDGYFLIKMQNSDDMNVVLSASPHMFFGKAAIVRPWSEKFDFHAEVLRTVPIWVKLPNLPLNCWGVDTLSKLGSVLGVPLCADEYGVLIEQKVVFEWTPPFCSKCNKVGHDCAIPRKVQPQKKQVASKEQPKQKVWVAKPQLATIPAPEPSVPEFGGNGSVHSAGVFTPAQTTLQDTSDDDWRVVGRKHRSHSNPPVFTSVPNYNTYTTLIKDGDGAGDLIPIRGDGNPPLGS
ncbi:uncharacterized protein LOC110701237 [Chenopodium quinoa]|uniref:uncharacterized protein LOC110701237 n=1 Tax=Chenopodium quinoa TaxID=63459 RepID=UPI000B791240|nr:uncharacterized protein LOC110701237 [Chenopodium quinoa]